MGNSFILKTSNLTFMVKPPMDIWYSTFLIGYSFIYGIFLQSWWFCNSHFDSPSGWRANGI